MGPQEFAGQVADWQTACRASMVIGPGDDAAARSFFEHLFRAYRLYDPSSGPSGGEEGLLTGYYQPQVRGSRRREAGFEVPLYRRPSDLIEASPGDMSAGRLVDGKLQPYYSRAEIDAGVLSGQGLELVWLASPIDAFFISIQGSAEIRLADGSLLRIGVAGSNGLGYVAIGRVLIEQGEIPADRISLQSLRAWLIAHPDRAPGLMERNPRYIFFHEIEGDGPVGAEGVALTPGRSLAVDPSFLPFGAPVYLDTQDGTGAPLRRLMLAQDSGAAIRGPLRGDVYWGEGSAAEAAAGPMNSSGKFYLLLPIGLTPAASDSGS